MIGGVIVMM